MIHVGMLVNPHHLNLVDRVWRTLDVEKHIQLILTLTTVGAITSINKHWGFSVFIVDGRIDRYGQLKQGIQQIRTVVPEAEVIVLHERLHPVTIKELYSQGVAGHLSARNVEPDLVPAIEHVCRNEAYIDSSALPAIVSTLSQNYSSATADALHERYKLLSTREQEIFAAMANGLGYAEVADKLGISIKTVRGHRTAVFRKLELHNSADLVGVATTLRIIAKNGG